MYLFPGKNFVLIDTDCVPTSLFEVEELARLMLAREDETKDFGPSSLNSQADPPCPAMVMLCSEAKAEINAGMIIVASCKLMAPHARAASANAMVMGLMASRRRYVNNKCPEPNYDDIAMSGLLWTPLLATQAVVPLHWAHAWALLGEWSGHICFPLPAASEGAKYHWPRHGTTDVLGEQYRQRRPALVNWAYPAFEQGALAPLVFLPSTFPILVLPGDKIFQSKHALMDFQLAPVTHAYGGSKSRVGQALMDKQHNPPLPLMAALKGANGLLPLWACVEGCDFVRGNRVTNQTLTSETMALEQHGLLFLQSMWRLTDPRPLTAGLWDEGAYQVTLTDCPDHLVALATRADPLLTQIASTTEAASLLKDGVAECWTSWSASDKDLFLQQWIFQLYHERVFLDARDSPDVHLEFSGLGGGQVLDNFVSDLLDQCVPSAPCYGASLAHLDVYNQNPKLRNTSSIGRTAQIHDYHMLHVAAWPTGVCAWLRILCQFGLPTIKAAEANHIMTQACLAAAIGRKKPAHLREPHPGYVNFMKILMLCLHPVPLQHFAVRVLLPLQQSIIGRLLAMPDGEHLAAMRVCHIIGHSAGSYGGMVLSKVLTDVAFMQLVGTTRVTAVALPTSLLHVRYGSSRRVHLVHVCDDKLCVWRPEPSDMKELEDRGIYATYLEGSFHWLGKACHNYGHLNAVQLDYGPHKVKDLLDVPGFVPAFEKQRAPLRLMSWCTYSVPDDLRQTLYRLSTLCAQHTTTPVLRLEEANRAGLQAQNEDQVKQRLIRSLICHSQWTGIEQLSWCRWQLPSRATSGDGSVYVGLLSPTDIAPRQGHCR